MKYFIVLIFSIFFFQSVFAQNQALDSLFSLYQQDGRVTTKEVDLLNEIAWEFNVVNLDSTKHYAELALDLAERKNYFVGQARALNLIAIYYSYEGDIDSSILLNNKALNLSIRHNFSKYQDGIYNDLAIDYGQKGDYEKSLMRYYKALDKLDEGSKYRVYTLANIAKTHAALGNEKQAKHYFNLADKLAKEITDKQVLHQVTRERAFYFSRDKQLDSALIYMKKANEISLAENMHLVAFADLIHMARIYLQMEKYDSCIVALQSINNDLLEIGGKSSEIEYNDIMSQAYSQKEEYDTALDYSLKCKTAVEEAGRKDYMPYIHRQLSQIYLAQKDFEGAYYNYVTYKDLRDSIASVEKEKAFLELDAQYQIERQEERNAELKKANVLLTIAAVFFVLFAAVSTLLLATRVRVNKILKTKNHELTTAKQEALEASATKQNFLSRMSHEIRTPLNAVIGFVTILIDEKPRLDQLPYLHHLKSSGQYLMHLINNLLDFSRLEAGKLEIKAEPFNLKILLEEVVDSFRLINTKEEVEIQLDYRAEELNQMLIGSSFRLNQILYNLMSNAFKFTHKGQVVLRATLLTLETSKQDTQIKFEVEDTGIGIPQDKQRKIFESFTQADSSIPQTFGGSGLGLSIVKDLLRLLGSKIQVESQENKGSNFSFILGFKLGENLQNNNSSSTFTKPTVVDNKFEGLKVLLAEDNLFNQKIAIKILENKGMVVTSAANGQEALERFQEETFDLVLMDLHMPVMNGEESVKQIRLLEKDQSRIPIILLSATTLDPFISNVRHMDVEYYIEKPFSPEVLYEAIGNCLVTKRNSNILV
ncbi:MAG: ATP-binding protein [Bacteroidota bacterium]